MCVCVYCILPASLAPHERHLHAHDGQGADDGMHAHGRGRRVALHGAEIVQALAGHMLAVHVEGARARLEHGRSRPHQRHVHPLALVEELATLKPGRVQFRTASCTPVAASSSSAAAWICTISGAGATHVVAVVVAVHTVVVLVHVQGSLFGAHHERARLGAYVHAERGGERVLESGVFEQREQADWMVMMLLLGLLEVAT